MADKIGTTEPKELVYERRRRNLTKLIERYGSRRALALSIAMTPQQLGEVLNGRAGFGDKVAERIETNLNVEPGFLDSPTIEEKTGAPIKPIAKPIKPATTSKFSCIPLLSSVQAGLPTDHGDLCYDEHIEVPGDLPKGCYALKVNGDSMSPLIDDGDVVVVDPNRWPKPGDCVVARSELENLSEATVKRYYPTGFDIEGREIFEARPFNPMYPTMHSVDQRLEVIGTVCKLIKDM